MDDFGIALPGAAARGNNRHVDEVVCRWIDMSLCCFVDIAVSAQLARQQEENLLANSLFLLVWGQ